MTHTSPGGIENDRGAKQSGDESIWQLIDTSFFLRELIVTCWAWAARANNRGNKN
jgi:hypothetical protein